jgi:antitoxin ParD1/3/4
MNVSVGPEFEDFIQRKVESGDYASASEVVREGLRMLKERDLLFGARLHELRGEIQDGIDEASAGKLGDGPEFLENLRQIVRDRGRKKA